MSKRHAKNKNMSDDDEEFDSSSESESESDQSGGERDDHDGDNPEEDADNPGEDDPEALESPDEKEAEGSDESDSDSDSEDEIIKDEDAESDASDQEDDGEATEVNDDEVSTGAEPKGSVYNDLNKGKEIIVFDDNAEKEYAMIPKRPVPKDERITGHIPLTTYEIARVIGLRAQQIANNAQPLVEGVNDYKPQVQANLEFNEGQSPIIIRRYLTMGWYEDFEFHELERLSELDDEYFLPPS